MKVKEALEGPEKKLTHRGILQELLFPDSLHLCHNIGLDITVLCLGKISAEPGQYRRIKAVLGINATPLQML